MHRLFLIFSSIVLSACMLNDVTKGESADGDGIVIAKFITIPANSPSLIFVEQRPLIGPNGLFKIEDGNTLGVDSMMPGTYSWGRIMTSAWTTDVYPGKQLPSFDAKRGCINYIGDITLDFTGQRPVMNLASPNSATLDEFKAKYPKMFAANAVCQ